MNGPFIPMENLEGRPMPNRAPKVQIRYPARVIKKREPMMEQAQELAQEPTQERIMEQEQEEELEPEFEPIKESGPMIAIDNRKTSNINRDLIRERLINLNAIIVQHDIYTAAQARPKVASAILAEGGPKVDIAILAEDLPKVEVEPILKKKKPVVLRIKETVALPEGLPEGLPEDEQVIQDLERILEEKMHVEEKTQLAEAEKKPTIKIKQIRKVKKIKGAIEELPLDLAKMQMVSERLPKERERINIRAPSYYMNNRKLFIQKLNDMFLPYRQEIMAGEDNVSCETRKQNDEFDLLTHQKIVRDYLNLYTPYRGLLLYHGLGSGKTCSSIAIAEGMKSDKPVYVLTPAALKSNFFDEMKKCGDNLYKQNQYWEFVSIDGQPEYVSILSKALSLSTQYIRNKGGAWLVDVRKSKTKGLAEAETKTETEGENKVLDEALRTGRMTDGFFYELHPDKQAELDKQIDEMIRAKYTDINYNGLSSGVMRKLTADFIKNPFDNAVVIIDEAHNFVSRIVNKIKRTKTYPYILYDYLMNASNARIVLLTGTPIINYPNEIGILYNILRGYIKSWTMTVNSTSTEKLNTDTILNILNQEKLQTFDFVEYTGNKLTITRNPMGFVNVKKRGQVPKERAKERAKEQEKEREKNKTKKIPPIKGGTKQHRPVKTTKKVRFHRSDVDKTIVLPKREPLEIDKEDDILDAKNRGFFGEEIYEHIGGTSEVFTQYNGVKLDSAGNITDADFQTAVVRALKKYQLEVPADSIEITKYKAIPDESEAFLNMFVDADSRDAKNLNLFQRRILGLTSYFRSAQEQLLPRYVPTETGEIYHIEKVEMSSHQFGMYEKIRKQEADREKSAKKAARKAAADELFTMSSTYRIFSRAACNFTFPSAIERPIPTLKANREINENAIDAIMPVDQSNELPALEDEEVLNEEGEDDEEVSPISESDAATYSDRIQRALEAINARDPETNESEFLSITALNQYSPKFGRLLANLQSEDNNGMHLIYSHFRTIEGIGILRLILLANGFAEFKIQKIGNEWDLVESEEDAGKPRFILYTGTESIDEKKILLNIYNGNWNKIPSNTIIDKLRERAENNNNGEIIKVMMITASGAEGINLRNTRFVHIMEPYWHMVRVEQVVGRARRICSHMDLPEELRTVKVYLYISTFSEEQRTNEKNIELRIRDVSKLDRKTPVTTDENLYELASIKNRINNQFLNAVKETAIDCNLYAGKNKDEPLVCYGYGKVKSNQFASYPSFERDRDEKIEVMDKVTWKAQVVEIEGVKYAMNMLTKELYDLASYKRNLELGGDLILIGRLVKSGKDYIVERV